ncbi:MAG: hypothetical protein U5K27_01430 [Desulfotignum sp.]|nr:hypothetical protein [Desulfotignum sp.]
MITATNKDLKSLVDAGRRTGLSRASIWKDMKKWDIPMPPE